jgi:tetratricopeptide (TPR) repeat protein
MRVEQLGADVVVRIRGTDGQLIEEFDSLTGTLGPETVSFIAPGTGAYRVEVRLADRSAAPETYEIQVQEIRRADSRDQQRIAARRHSKELRQALVAAIEAKNDTELVQRFEAAAKELKNPGSEPIGFATALESAMDVPLTMLEDDFQRSVNLSHQLLSIAEETFGSDNPVVVRGLMMSAEIAHQTGNFNEAATLALRATDIASRVYGPDLFSFAKLFDQLGRIHHMKGDYEEAEKYFRLALTRIDETPGSDNNFLATVNANLAALYVDAGRDAEAEVLFLKSIGIQEALSPETDDLASTLNGLGTVYLSKDIRNGLSTICSE